MLLSLVTGISYTGPSLWVSQGRKIPIPAGCSEAAGGLTAIWQGFSEIMPNSWGGMLTYSKRLTCLLVVVAMTAPGMALAQQYFDPGLFQKSIEQKPEDYQPPGARLGSFMLLPGAELAWEHNDNVFYTPTGTRSDSVWHVRPYADLRSDWNRHALNFSAWGDFARYQSFGENDYDDWALRADGRVDVLQNSWFSADISRYHLHEDRRDPAAGAPLTPTEFDYDGYGFGYDHVFNRLKVGGYYNHNSFDYDNNVTGEGEFIDNQDRNRDQDRYTLRADYQLGPETAIFGSYGWNSIDYDLPVDFEGFNRNSDGTNASVGVVWDMTDLLTGDLSVNWSEQDYDDPALRDVDGWGLGAGLTWTPQQTTLINVRMAASPQETAQNGIGGYFSRLYSARLQQELKRNLLFNVRGSFTDNDYENSGLTTDELTQTEVVRVGLGLSYLFNRNFYVTGGYAYEKQRSNEFRFTYEINRLFLALGVEL